MKVLFGMSMVLLALGIAALTDSVFIRYLGIGAACFNAFLAGAIWEMHR